MDQALSMAFGEQCNSQLSYPRYAGQTQMNPMKMLKHHRLNDMAKWSRLSTGALVAALYLAAGSVYAQTLAEFNFDEGSGSTTTSKTGELVGSLGVPIDPANDPAVITDSPSGTVGDTAVQLRGTGFLVVEDTPSPILRS
jgi:hypothetical protein